MAIKSIGDRARRFAHRRPVGDLDAHMSDAFVGQSETLQGRGEPA
jgi:hypothetical protein